MSCIYLEKYCCMFIVEIIIDKNLSFSNLYISINIYINICTHAGTERESERERGRRDIIFSI
jgi:5'-3' exonuclease